MSSGDVNLTQEYQLCDSDYFLNWIEASYAREECLKKTMLPLRKVEELSNKSLFKGVNM